MYIKMTKINGKYRVADWTKFNTVEQAKAASNSFDGPCFIVSDLIIDELIEVYNEEDLNAGNLGSVHLYPGECNSL